MMQRFHGTILSVVVVAISKIVPSRPLAVHSPRLNHSRQTARHDHSVLWGGHRRKWVGSRTHWRLANPRSSSNLFASASGLHMGGREAVSENVSMQHVSSVEEIAQKHSTFLLDMWGVMHNGSRPYDGVLETIAQLKKAGKRMVIISNSSKRKDKSTKMLSKLGFDPEDFDQIITSGEVSHRMLSGDTTLQCNPWPALSDLHQGGSDVKTAYVFGSGDGDEEYVTSAGWMLSPISKASLIVARGTFTINDGSGSVISKIDDGEEKYFQTMEEALKVAASRNVPMLVCNPDKVRPDEGLPPMPGAIGDSYEVALEANGVDEVWKLVKRVGKPYREVYDLAFDGEPDVDAACMVGDALETDITGGMAAGCSTLWVVRDGIHGPDVDEHGMQRVIDDFNSPSDFERRMGGIEGVEVRPTFVVPHFRW